MLGDAPPPEDEVGVGVEVEVLQSRAGAARWRRTVQVQSQETLGNAARLADKTTAGAAPWHEPSGPARDLPHRTTE